MSLINAGEDPKYIAGSSTFVSTWSCATSHQLDGIGCGEGEQRLYVISDAEHIERCFPPRIPREPNCTLLNWELLKQVKYIRSGADQSCQKLYQLCTTRTTDVRLETNTATDRFRGC